MFILALTPISKLLFPINPAIWQCPIQQGIPYLITLAVAWLTLIAALVFLYGIGSAVVFYLTAFGDEDRAKKGRESLKWSIIGAVVIMLSVMAIEFVSGYLLVFGPNALAVTSIQPGAGLCTTGEATVPDKTLK